MSSRFKRCAECGGGVMGSSERLTPDSSELHELARAGLEDEPSCRRVLRGLLPAMRSGIPICSDTGMYLHSRFSRVHLVQLELASCITHLTLSLRHRVQAMAVLLGVERGMVIVECEEERRR